MNAGNKNTQLNIWKVAMSETKKHEYDWEEIGQNASKQLMDIYIIPELKRRQEIGELPKPLDLLAAQIIFYADGRERIVRFNSEVKIIIKMKLKEGFAKKSGDSVHTNEVETIEELTLTDEDDPDCGHVTFVKFNDTWIMVFDAVYNKDLAKKTIETASEFIEAAEFSLIQQNWSAFADNLFSAAELLAKATLLVTWSDPNFREKTSHKAIHSRYNRFSRLGNTHPLHAETFNNLSEMRYHARYSKNEFSLTEAEGKNLLGDVKSMLQETNSFARINNCPE